MIITPTSLTINQLFGSQNEQYVIPAYQRRYSWQEKQLLELLDDIQLIEGSDTHLLGSIVCLTGHHTAGINRLELVDGQQRITTICILLQCIMERLKQDHEMQEASAVEHLLQAKALGGAPVRKVLLDSIDAKEFDQFAHGKFVGEPLNPSLSRACETLRRWVNERSLTELGTFLYRLKNQSIVIRLDVNDAKDAFKLFETINNRGLRLSPTDIIKNFVLGNAARFGKVPLELARERWAELIQSLDSTSLDAFFKQYLCAKLRKRIRGAFVIPYFKTVFMRQVTEAASLPDQHFYVLDNESDEDLEEGADAGEAIDPASVKLPPMRFSTFMDDLVLSAKAYGQIARGDTGVKAIDRHLRNLRMIKSLQSYGFLMALRVRGCTETVFVDVLRLTEAFMLRRHVCRERSSENESVFARLCGVNAADPIPEVIAEFRAFAPADEKFRTEFSRVPFAAGIIDRARYCLEQFEHDSLGKHLELIVASSDAVHIEHIIPQKIKSKKAKDEHGDWPEYLGTNSVHEHPAYVARIGNLTLIAGALNISASNGPYERKKKAYLDSAIGTTKSIPAEFPEFRFAEIDQRSKSLAKAAVKLWPIP